MTLERTMAGINKTASHRTPHTGTVYGTTRIADALQLAFPTLVVSCPQIRGCICRETLCDGSSVTF
jgi:hypothetical protein